MGDLRHVLRHELLEELSEGGDVPVVSESGNNGAEELVLKLLELSGAQESFDLRDEGLKLELVDEGKDVIETGASIAGIAFA